jgi:hypothetical protein
MDKKNEDCNLRMKDEKSKQLPPVEFQRKFGQLFYIL